MGLSTIIEKIFPKWQKGIIVYKKIRCSIHYNQEKAVGFKNNNKKHGLIFYYNIWADLMLRIGYVSVSRIPCRCSACLRKVDSPWNRRQDKYNQY